MNSTTLDPEPLPVGVAAGMPNGRKRTPATASRTALVLATVTAMSIIAPMTFAAAQTPSPAPHGTMTPGTMMPDLTPPPERAPQPRTAEEMFVILDDNGDGCVDAGEWRLRFMAVFFLLDIEGDTAIPGSKGDERLTSSEVPLIKPETFAIADTDHDGTISAYEYNQAPFTRFAAIPKARKGCLTVQELGNYLAGLRGEPK